MAIENGVVKKVIVLGTEAEIAAAYLEMAALNLIIAKEFSPLEDEADQILQNR